MKERFFRKKLHVGIIGCGQMGRHHMRAINLQDNASIEAVADPFASQDELAGLISPETMLFPSASEMLEDTNLDVVHIVTPPETHAELAIMALQSGANVYVEKPFTLRREEAEAIYELARERGLHVCAGHQVLFQKPSIVARKSLAEIGELVHVESYFSFRTARRNISPVDQLIDILPHPTCLLLHFLEYVCDKKPRIESICTDPEGEVRAMLQAGNIYGFLNVTLRGRPVESYLKIVGTNGSLFADFVRGTVIKLPGPGSSAISVVYNTYSQPLQSAWKATCFFAGMLLKKHKSYPGLTDIIKAFYSSITHQSSFDLSHTSTIATVSLCENISLQLKKDESIQEDIAKQRLEKDAKKLPRPASTNEFILITGGTGLLGRKTAEELRSKGHNIRILARKIPPYSKQLPGVEYHTADLGDVIPEESLSNVSTIIHCAAETAGGQKEHERNTIQATRNLIETASKCGVKKVVNISSIAVLKSGRETGGQLDESTPVDTDNISRGPYVWGKAKAEIEGKQLGEKLGVTVKTIRLGPLVDFTSFEAPGRLGKEIGPFFVAVGSSKSSLSLCDLLTAAKVIRFYTENFDDSPTTLNLVEPNSPTRGQLLTILKVNRPDLHCLWLPFVFLKIGSPLFKLVQRILLPGKKPIDLCAVFSSERYNTQLAAKVINNATQGPLS